VKSAFEKKNFMPKRFFATDNYVVPKPDADDMTVRLRSLERSRNNTIL
jgi:hypothetical protein